MKKILLVMMVVLFSMMVGAGTACAGAYFSGNLAYVMLDDTKINDPSGSPLNGSEISFNGGFGLLFAMGNEIHGIRYEGEFSYTTSDVDQITSLVPLGPLAAGTHSMEGEVSRISLMGNVYKDFNTNSPVAPFVGLGIGISQVEGEMTSIAGIPLGTGSEDDTVFAYQVLLGCAFKVNEKMNVDVSYRYFATDDPTFDTTEIEISAHNILAGVRMAF